MALAAGTSFGPYEVLALIGAGGMGEVYKARDKRLDRVVAIKVLPDRLAGDPKFRERFEREARAISQLDHPHICALYDVGEERGTAFLVMQYLEGETLADRLRQAPLPLDDALMLATQIAGALDDAHRKGITHRDLKPANVMVTKAGAKLLDFGLAKALPPATPPGSLTGLPTTPPELTAQGTILGTFQYMAPEQLEGQEADFRTDIFAFGAVLYETLTGKRAFEAKSQASLITAIMSATPPPVASLQPLVPQDLDRVISKCLAKDPEDRWQSARDLKDELIWIRNRTTAPSATNTAVISKTATASQKGWSTWGWIAAAVSFLIATGAILAGRSGYFQPPVPKPLTFRSSIVFPPGLTTGLNTAAERLSLSPDGKRIVFAATVGEDQRRRLFVRATDSLSMQVISGTEDSGAPFWSPDSRFVGFVGQGKLKKTDVSGGPPVTLAEAAVIVSGAWGPDDTILFTPKTGPLFRVSAAGGEAVPVTTLEPGEVIHSYPFFLPDGKHFVYLAQSIGSNGAPAGAIFVASLDPKEKRKRLVDVMSNVKFASGRLLYLRDRSLVAHSLDLDRLELTGEPEVIADQIEIGGNQQGGAFAVSNTDVLLYRTGTESLRSVVQWVDRSGKMSVVGQPLDQMSLELSPDGKRAVVSVLDAAKSTRDLWMYELSRALLTRFTFDASDEIHAVWAKNGDQVIFNSRRNGRLDLFQKPASGAGVETLLYSDGTNNLYPSSISPDGKLLLYYNGNAASRTSNDLWVLPLSGEPKPTAVVHSDFSETLGQFSPDGRWIAYVSTESGRQEIYVVPFPGPGGKWQVSNTGGSLPRWRPDGKEIFFLDPESNLKAATITSRGQALEIGPVQNLFQMRIRTTGFAGANGYPYDVAPDGNRFLANTVNESPTSAPFTLVVNWTASLKK